MQELYKSRRFVVQGLVIAASLLLVFKALQLQVLDTSYQEQQGFRQTITLYPSRGLIYDRNGKLLINNQAMYDLMVTYNQVRNIDTLRFCRLLGISKETFVENLEKDFDTNPRFSRHKPFVFLKKISAERYARFREHLYEFPGFFGQLRNVRGYPVAQGAHALGYISEVTKQQIEQTEGLYQRGDYIGASGLEYAYEKQLRGIRGRKQVLRDKFGRIQGSYKEGEYDKKAVPGTDLVASIDIDLQAYGEQLMRNKKGAIVAIEPSTGEVLALVSSPTYAPNLLTIGRGRGEAYQRLRQDSLNPFFNRALSAKYPPGSIFKPILSLIALERGNITASTGMSCRGGYYYNDLRVGCHGHPHTSDVGKAIQYSCNNYYCQVFREVVNTYGFEYPEKGLADLAEHLHNFGLGRQLGIDLPGELGGNVPTPEDYNKTYGEGRWKFSHAVSVGIGQGELEVTPLQMANMAAIIANRGYYYTPHLAREFKNGNEVALAPYREQHWVGVHPRHFDPVIQGMEDVVRAGTGRRAYVPHINICGKTGTVENHHGKDHSTFIAFAPKDKPEIAIAVYVENGGYGSTFAAPISSLMIEKYLTDSISTQRLYLEKRMLDADLISRKQP